MSQQIGSILKKLVIVGLVAAVTATESAPAQTAPPPNGVATNVVVSGIGMVSTLGTMVFIEIAGYQTGNGYKAGNPSCSTNGPGQWSFVLPLTTTIQQQMLTALLTAHTTGSPVTLVGNGMCDTYSTVETLTNIIF
jgi:hypothetical protein